MVSLEMAKRYLRVDSSDEDEYIQSLITTSVQLCENVSRRDRETLANYKSLSQTAILYAVGYLFEHREEADHKELLVTLRNLLFVIREEIF